MIRINLLPFRAARRKENIRRQVSVFLLMIIFALTVYFIGAFEEEIPSDVALVLAPSGNIVIQKTYAKPMTAFLGGSRGEEKKRETLLRDITDSLDYARDDKRIKMLVLDLKNLRGVGISKLQEIGAALKRFKQSGKKIIAIGDNYHQNQYYLAAHAHEIWLHPHGNISLSGYGVYRAYFRDALAKLMVQFHVFRVGSYKSALEPFIRDDMSPEAKEANLAWLKVLWDSYQTDVATLRNLDNGALDDYINNLNKHDKIDKYKLFRIYRDVRFSKDKTPYQPHFAASFSREGKELRGGYYLRIRPNNESFVGGGFWDPNKEDLLRIRKEFELDATEIRRVLADKKFQTTFGTKLEGSELKTAPKGFDKNHPNIDLIRKKGFIAVRNFTDKEVLSSDFLEVVDESFKNLRPFFDLMSAILTTDLNGESLV